MRVVLECVHEVNLREPGGCDDCGRELDSNTPTQRIVDSGEILEAVARLEADSGAGALRAALEAISQAPATDDPLDLLQEHWAIAGAALEGRPLPT